MEMIPPHLTNRWLLHFVILSIKLNVDSCLLLVFVYLFFNDYLDGVIISSGANILIREQPINSVSGGRYFWKVHFLKLK